MAFTLTVSPKGGLVKLSHSYDSDYEKPCMNHRGKRGRVNNFSESSRLRLFTWLNSIDRDRMQEALFVTLTYPREWPRDWEVWKRDLDVFLKRLQRQAPTSTTIWRLEYQRRGAPHFHLLILGLAYIGHDWIANNWWETCGQLSPDHLRAGTNIKKCTNWRTILSYLGKYIAKRESEKVRHHGRVWGVRGRANLPANLVSAPLEPKQFYTARRYLKRIYAEKTGRDPWFADLRTRGITVFCEPLTAQAIICGVGQGSFAIYLEREREIMKCIQK